MARPREPIDLVIAKGKKHLTKQEIEKRRKEELHVDLKDVQAPEYLPEKLKIEFMDIAGKLLRVGIMTELDEDTLARYLLSKQQYLQYTNLLTKATRLGKTDEAYKLMMMQDKAFKQCSTVARDLGLTISSRVKLVMPEIKEPEKKVNKFDKFKVR